MKKGKRLLSIILIALMLMPVPLIFDEPGRFSFAVDESGQETAEGSVTEGSQETVEGAGDDASSDQNEEITADNADEEVTPGSAETDELPSGPAEESAADEELTEVTVVNSAKELARESSAADNDPFFTIDVSKKKPSDELATEEITDEVREVLTSGISTEAKKESVTETLEDSGFYEAKEGSGKSVEVTSRFAFQRLMLLAEYKENLQTYGAVKAVFYNDYYLLSYDSEEAAKTAYDALTAEYGDSSVQIDIPLKADSIRGWGTSYMGLDSEMTAAADGEDVIVAVCDTGIYKDHEIFSDTEVLSGYNFVSGNADVTDDHGHGTSVAGIIAESTPSNVKILPIKVLKPYYDSEKGEYYAAGSPFDIMEGIEYAENYGADIINLSLGGNMGSIDKLNYYDDIFLNYDALIVCSSGNENIDLDGSGIHYFPAELDSTICVGSINKSGERSSFSNYGDAVDFAAPGKGILVANYTSTNAYSSSDGTSFSSPYIAAAAAVIKAEEPDSTKNDIFEELESRSLDLGSEGSDKYFGMGCPVFTGQGGNTLVNITDNSSIKISGIASRTYNGGSQTQNITVKRHWFTLNEGTDYTISYSNNINPGTATMTITGMGNYSGSISKTFTINYPAEIVDLPSVKISKPSKGKRRLTAKWKKVSKKNQKKIAGIEIQIVGPGVNTIYTAGKSKKSKAIKGLVSKQKYSVRVRAYRYDGYYKHVSGWSGFRTVKVK